MSLQRISMNVSGSLIRHDTMAGKNYLVAPMVMAVEGVLGGSDGPLLYTANELAKHPESWNLKPVVVYHPEINGAGVSACDPDILTNHQVGVILNTKFDDGKLKAEAWLDPLRIDVVDNRLSVAITDNEMMELSTGLFVEVDKTPGEFNGKAYDGLATNLRPDHLALLPDKIGACSIADGAGLLRNQGLSENELSYETIRDQLRVEIVSTTDTDNVWVVDVFADSFIYSRDAVMYRQNYTAKNDKIAVSGVPVQVDRIYEYVVVNGKKQEKTIVYKDNVMDVKEIANGLIENGSWSENDRAFLESQSEDSLMHLQNRETELATEAAEKAAADKKGEDVAKIDAVVADVTKVEGNEEKTMATWLADAPPGAREMFEQGMTTHNAAKAQLVATILKNERNVLNEQALKSKSFDDLSAMAALCVEAVTDNSLGNYIGLAGTVSNGHVEEPMEMTPMGFGD